MNKYIRTSAKLLCCILAVLMLLSNLQPAIYAANTPQKIYSYKTVSLALNSNEDDRSTIQVYYIGDVAFISIDDLCSLTRSKKTTENGRIIVSHGILNECTFDPKTETFTDRRQCVSVNMIPLPNGDYAVPAIPFLYYYQATAWISNDTLHSNMPNFTPWEALDVDLNGSIVDYAGLYGGQEATIWSTIWSVLNEFFLGKPMNWTKYMDTAISYALSVDIFSYSAVQDYIKETNLQMQDYLQSEKAQKYLTALELASPAGREAIKYLISRHYDASFKNLVLTSANAFHNGDRVKYLDFLDEAFDELDTKTAINKGIDEIFLYAEWMAIGASAVTNAYQAMNLNNETDHIIYKVLGSENLARLGLQNDWKDWGKRADVFKNDHSIAAEHYNLAVWDFFTQATTSAKENLLNEFLTKGTFNFNYGGTATFGLKLGQHIAAQFPHSKAMHENLNLLNLVNLQEACANVLVATAQKVDAAPDNAELFCEYLPVLKLYLRISIACYSKFAEYIDKYASEHTDIKADFEKRANQFAVDLYRISTLTANDPEVFRAADLRQHFLTPVKHGKSVSTVDIFENGKHFATDYYSYGKYGLLTEVRRVHSFAGSPNHFTRFHYNDSRQLISITEYESYSPPSIQTQYTYNEKSLLTTYSFSDNGVYGYQLTTTYKYDGDRPIRATNQLSGGNGNSVSEYFYDDKGRVAEIQTKDDYGTDIWRYTYDNADRMIAAEYSRAYSEAFTITYNYDYAPFTISVTPDLGEPYNIHSAYFTDSLGKQIYSYDFSDPVYTASVDGYLAQVTDKAANRVYTFHYKENSPDNNALYASVLNEYEAAALSSKYTYEDDRSIFPNVTSNIMVEYIYLMGSAELLYAFKDIDGNGVDELLIGYKANDFNPTPLLIDIYTHNGLYPIKLFYDSSIGNEGVLGIYTDGTIAFKGSVSGGIYFENYYKFSKNGFTLELAEAFEYNIMEGFESVFDTNTYKNYTNNLTEIPTPEWTALPIDYPFS